MKYIFREQVDRKGYYCEIVLTTSFDEVQPIELIIDYNANTEWEIACKAGINIFFDYFARRKQGQLKVVIEEIKWLPVDTDNIIVLYSVIKALSENLQVEINGLSFEKAEKSFVIPESRSVW